MKFCFYCGRELKLVKSIARGCGEICFQKHEQLVARLTDSLSVEAIKPIANYPTTFNENKGLNLERHNSAIADFISLATERDTLKNKYLGRVPTAPIKWKSPVVLSADTVNLIKELQEMRQRHLAGDPLAAVVNMQVRLMLGDTEVLAGSGAWYPDLKCFGFYDRSIVNVLKSKKEEMSNSADKLYLMLDGEKAIVRNTFSLKVLAALLISKVASLSRKAEMSDLGESVEQVWKTKRCKRFLIVDTTDGVHPAFFFFR